MSHIQLLRLVDKLPAFTTYEDEAIWARVEARRNRDEVESPPTGLKIPEWRVLSNPASTRPTHDFKVRQVTVPEGYERALKRVVLAERLQVVQALIGFTRIESAGDATEGYGDPNEALEGKRAPLARRKTSWVPTAEVRGEGIFIEFREEVFQSCLGHNEQLRQESLWWDAHRRWRQARHIKHPELGDPGLRYVFLHSFSHALIRQLTLECGYDTASIRKRIYSLSPEADGGPMAGILLYTSAPIAKVRWVAWSAWALLNNLATTWMMHWNRCKAARQILYALNTARYRI